MDANFDIELYKRAYFYFDTPVDYTIKSQKMIQKIYPIMVKDSEFFLSSCTILMIDKNSSDSVEIIQMSYLEFMFKVLFLQDQLNVDKFLNICKYCLHIENPKAELDEKGKIFIKDEATGIIIKGRDFEDIRKIILYQNLIHYDDEYVNPEAKKAMEEMDKLRNAGVEDIPIERKIAIITSHCGLSKQEQLSMTFRSHSLLFEEVAGEVEFQTTRPMLIYAGKGNEIDHWIYKKKRNKFDDYFMDSQQYKNKTGLKQT